MEQVKIKIGPVAFDHADSDVLYLHVGEPQEAEGKEAPEGQVLRYAPGTQNIVGLTVLGARRPLDRDGNLTVTIPEPIEASAESCPSVWIASAPAGAQINRWRSRRIRGSSGHSSTISRRLTEITGVI